MACILQIESAEVEQFVTAVSAGTTGTPPFPSVTWMVPFGSVKCCWPSQSVLAPVPLLAVAFQQSGQVIS